MYFLISFVTWIHLLHEFHYFCLLHEFTYVCLNELLGVDTMAPKEAKKRMKASENKKRKLLQTTKGPTPRKTVSHQAPSIELMSNANCDISWPQQPFLHFNHSHHPRLKSEAILWGQSVILDLVKLIF